MRWCSFFTVTGSGNGFYLNVKSATLYARISFRNDNEIKSLSVAVLLGHLWKLNSHSNAQREDFIARRTHCPEAARPLVMLIPIAECVNLFLSVLSTTTKFYHLSLPLFKWLQIWQISTWFSICQHPTGCTVQRKCNTLHQHHHQIIY